jgi:hypothetical protein
LRKNLLHVQYREPEFSHARLHDFQ